MAFQAFKRKRITQLGALTQRRNRLDDLLGISEGVEQDKLNFQRTELMTIRKTHDDIIDAMNEQPECQGEAAVKLQDNIEKFMDAFEAALQILRQLEAKNLQGGSSASLNEGASTSQQQQLPAQVPQIQLNTNQIKARVDYLIKYISSTISFIDMDQSDTYSSRQLQSTLSTITNAADELKDAVSKLIILLDHSEKEVYWQKTSEMMNIIFTASS